MEITASMVKDLREASGAGMMDCKKALAECNGDMNASIEWLREKGIAKSAKKESRIAAEGLANIFTNDSKAVMIEVNSETDFVSKNDEFKNMIDTIGNTILNSNAKTLDEALLLSCDEGTIKDLIVAKTAKIGEKLSLRRICVVEKNEDEFFGTYLHMGGKIAALVLLKGGNEGVAKDIAMQVAAMKPEYLTSKDVPAEVVENERKVLKEQLLNKDPDKASKADFIVEGKIKKFFEEVCLADQAFIKENKMTVNKYVTDNNAELLKMVRYEVGEGMEKRNDNFAEEVMNQVKGN